MPSFPRSLATGLVALILLAGAAAAQTRAPRERDVWYAYLEGGVRYGAHHLQVTTLADGNYRYEVTVRVQLDLFGMQPQAITSESVFVVTPALRPVSMRVETTQLSGTDVVTGRMDADVWTVSWTEAGEPREVRTPIDPAVPVFFSVCLEDWLAGLDSAVERAEARVFADTTGAVTDVAATRVEDVGGVVWQLTSGETEGDRLTLDADGVIAESFTGSTEHRMVRCTSKEANDLAYLAMEGSSVLSFPLDRELGRLDGIERLVVELTWRDIPFDAFELEDARQRLLEQSEADTGTRRATVEILAPAAPLAKLTLPVEDAALAPYLAETELIKPGNARIQAAARAAIGDERDVAAAVAALAKWVNEYVEGQMIVESLSGPEVLERKAGKCTEYATLYASMARAVGIPTRVVLGERIFDGSWGGHIWNESWIGHWVTVDPTVNEIDRSFALLKFVHSDSVEGTQPLRMALVESLSISIAEVVHADGLPGLATGIDGVTYTNVQHGLQLTAPSEEWQLVDVTRSGGEVTVECKAPGAEQLAIHFVAFDAKPRDTPESVIDGRLGQWQAAFAEDEVLTHEPREVGEHAAFLSLHSGKNENTKTLHRLEVVWVRGASGFLLTMTGLPAEHEARLDDFEALLASFRLLED